MSRNSTDLHITVLDWSNTQNGKLIGSIGIVSALLQGGYVRRSMSKVGEGNMARRGVSACALALVLLALLPRFVGSSPSTAMKLLQAAAVCMAFTSATVVNSLTAFASLQCDEGHVDEVTGKVTQEHPELAKGKALGQFRSSGQLGRALGPLLGELLDISITLIHVVLLLAAVAIAAAAVRCGSTPLHNYLLTMSQPTQPVRHTGPLAHQSHTASRPWRCVHSLCT